MRSRQNWTKALSAALACLAIGACSKPQPVELQLVAFSTVVSISVAAEHAEQVDDAIAELEQHYLKRDIDWYPWPKPGARDGGALTAANQALAAGEAATLDPALANLVRRGQAISARTGGTFSMLTGRLQELWQAAGALGTRPEADALASAVDAIGKTTLTWSGDQLSSDTRNIVIDPGGISKGALLAESLDILEEHGISNVIVDLGGDLAVSGSVHGRPARIGIRAADGSGVIASLDIGDGEAVVTSGNYERFVEIGGVRYSHIIDPRTGEPLQHSLSATVIHEDPVLADAAATALMVGGFGEFAAICL